MNELTNQVAVVTGAGRGIGRAIALKFAAAGADVVCVSRTADNAEKAAAEVRALGRKAWGLAVDVADAAAVTAATERILAEPGRVVGRAFQFQTLTEQDVHRQCGRPELPGREPTGVGGRGHGDRQGGQRPVQRGDSPDGVAALGESVAHQQVQSGDLRVGLRVKPAEHGQ